MLGVVQFSAGGSSYECAFTASAMVAYEQKYDAPFLALVTELDSSDISSLRMSLMVDLFTFAVKARNRDLDDVAVADIVDEIGPKRIFELVGEAVRAAFPDEGKAGKKPTAGRAKKAPPKT